MTVARLVVLAQAVKYCLVACRNAISGGAGHAAKVSEDANPGAHHLCSSRDVIVHTHVYIEAKLWLTRGGVVARVLHRPADSFHVRAKRETNAFCNLRAHGDDLRSGRRNIERYFAVSGI